MIDEQESRIWESFYYKCTTMSDDDVADWIYNKLTLAGAHGVDKLFPKSPNPFMTKILLIGGIYNTISQPNKMLMRMIFSELFENYEYYWSNDYLTEYNARAKKGWM